MYKDNGYIYKVYKGTEGFYHCERFPIIYSNSKNIYYKPNGSEELARYSRRYLYTKENIEQMFECKYYIPDSFMCLESFAKEELEEYSEKMKDVDKITKKTNLQRRYFEAKKTMFEIAVKYEELTHENIEDVTDWTKNFWESFYDKRKVLERKLGDE